MFGRNLAETVTYEFRKTGGYIPIFVERSVEFIRDKGWQITFMTMYMCNWYMYVCLKNDFLSGLNEEGLFRLPGDQKQVTQLRDAFNKGKD